MLFLGCHLSASDGFTAMVETAEKIGANTFAFFTRNPRGSRAKEEDPADAARAVEMLRSGGCCPWGLHHEPVRGGSGCQSICRLHSGG